MLHFPKGFRVPKAYRHPHFLLLPTTPSQAVVEFVAILRERDQLHQLFRPDDVWPSANFSLSQHEADLEWQHSEFLAKRSFAYGLWSPEREPEFWGGVYLYPSVLPEVEVEFFFGRWPRLPSLTPCWRPSCAPGWARCGTGTTRACRGVSCPGPSGPG